MKAKFYKVGKFDQLNMNLNLTPVSLRGDDGLNSHIFSVPSFHRTFMYVFIREKIEMHKLPRALKMDSNPSRSATEKH